MVVSGAFSFCPSTSFPVAAFEFSFSSACVAYSAHCFGIGGRKSRHIASGTRWRCRDRVALAIDCFPSGCRTKVSSEGDQGTETRFLMKKDFKKHSKRLKRLLYHQTVLYLLALPGKTTARTLDLSSRGRSTHLCHSAVVGRRACGSLVRASSDDQRTSSMAVFLAHNCRACAVGASWDLKRED